MRKKAAWMRSHVERRFEDVFARTMPLEESILDIAVEVIMNGPGTADYRDGVIDCLINLYGAAGDGDLVLKSNL